MRTSGVPNYSIRRYDIGSGPSGDRTALVRAATVDTAFAAHGGADKTLTPRVWGPPPPPQCAAALRGELARRVLCDAGGARALVVAVQPWGQAHL